MASKRVPQGIKRGRLTAEEDRRIEEMASRNLTAGQIANKLNRHPGTINWAMYRLNLKETTPRPIAPYTRNGRVVRGFSADEDAFITQLRVDGLSSTEIAESVLVKFGHRRTSATIRIRLVMLATHEVAT